MSRYPKQQRLLALKKASVEEHALPPSYMPLTELNNLSPTKFDVILIDPPFSSSFSWETLQSMPIPSLAADPSFVFLWVGSGAGEGLERGREVLARWGYRRCEDVVWVKTNKATNKGPGVCINPRSQFCSTFDTDDFLSDRPANHVITHSNQAALPHWYQRHRSPVYRQLVCAL